MNIIRCYTVHIPAVVVPSFLNTGFSLARSDVVVLGRMPSSTEMVTGFSSPVFGSTIFSRKNYHHKVKTKFFSCTHNNERKLCPNITLVGTGMISSLNLPAAVAAAAFLCDSTCILTKVAYTPLSKGTITHVTKYK